MAVGTKARRWQACLRWGGRKPQRAGNARQAAIEIIGYCHAEAPMDSLRFGKHGIDRIDRAGRHANLRKRIEPPLRGVFDERLFDQGKDGFAVCHPCPVGCENRIISGTIEAGNLAEFSELRIIAHGKDDMAIFVANA